MSWPFFLSRFLLFERECNSFARDTAIKREPPPPLWNNKFLETKRQLFKWLCQYVRPYVTVSTISNFCSTTEEVFYGKLESEIDLHRLLCLFFRKLYFHGILFLGKSEAIKILRIERPLHGPLVFQMNSSISNYFIQLQLQPVHWALVQKRISYLS